MSNITTDRMLISVDLFTNLLFNLWFLRVFINVN